MHAPPTCPTSMALVSEDHAAFKDVSTKILGSISEVSRKTLTAKLAAEWVSELEANIQQTKVRTGDKLGRGLLDLILSYRIGYMSAYRATFLNLKSSWKHRDLCRPDWPSFPATWTS